MSDGKPYPKGVENKIWDDPEGFKARWVEPSGGHQVEFGYALLADAPLPSVLAEDDLEY